MRKVADAGIPIVLGTDTGFVGIILGVSTHLELSLLVKRKKDKGAGSGTSMPNVGTFPMRNGILDTLSSPIFRDRRLKVVLE